MISCAHAVHLVWILRVPSGTLALSLFPQLLQGNLTTLNTTAAPVDALEDPPADAPAVTTPLAALLAAPLAAPTPIAELGAATSGFGLGSLWG